MTVATELTARFKQQFGRHPRLYSAPGRVNLIGEHTDYNQGFVMPAAVGLRCWAAVAPRADGQLNISSTHFSNAISVVLGDEDLSPRGDWSDYAVGTAWALRKAGNLLVGADVLIHSEVPIGSGLSSSAAVEVCTGYSLLDVSDAHIDLMQLALACHRAENEFVGARVGIMDQFISTHGRLGQAMMLDCRSMEAQPLPIPPDIRLVVCNTGVKHQLAGGEYNVRRAQCEEGVMRLESALQGVESLRDVTESQLFENKELLPDLIYRRCRHVVSENQRVKGAAAALAGRNLATLGILMAESHRSLRNDYEVSCRELDVMVEIAAAQPGVIGARMTGGGFGGCTINLVQAAAAETFAVAVKREYAAQMNLEPEVYILNAVEGVHAVDE